MWQQELFLEEKKTPISIPGFRLELNYLTPDEETELLARVETGPWQTDFRRRIQQYGLGYGGKLGSAPGWLRDFPDWLIPLAERVGCDASFQRFPENCVINEYIPPLGIGPHRDYPDFGDTVACVSLGSDIVIDFSNPDQHLDVPVDVPARSFWTISGDARWKWLHGIAPRLNDVVAGRRRPRSRRVSITFRTGKNAP